MPELRRGNEDYRVHQRPRCGRCDSEASRDGRGEVTSRSTERGSSLRRFLRLTSVAAACAGCVREAAEGLGTGVRGVPCGDTPCRLPAPADSVDGPTRASPPCDPKRRPNTVVVWTRSKGNSYFHSLYDDDKLSFKIELRHNRPWPKAATSVNRESLASLRSDHWPLSVGISGRFRRNAHAVHHVRIADGERQI